MSIETTIAADGSFVKLELNGIFDIKKSLQMQDIINSLPESINIIHIDVANVSQIDASIFSTLLLLYFQKKDHSKIEVINCDKALAHRLSLAGLDRLVRIRMSTEKNSGYIQGTEQDSDESKGHQ